MDHAAQHAEHHHPMPTRERALDGVALSATLHCLTGCAIGEVLGMVIGTAVGLSDVATIVLAVLLAFFFGYSLTSLPLLRAGLALSAVVPIALAADTASIALMELVDNLIMVVIPGAMDAGVGNLLFWGSLSVALVVAGMFAFPLNRWLIVRGKGHAVVHETGIHGGPDVRVVGAIAVVAAIFGSVVLVEDGLKAETESAGHGGGEPAAGGHGGGGHEPATMAVRGLSDEQDGLRLELEPAAGGGQLRFRVIGASDGEPVTDFEVEHEKRMHLIVVSRDTSEFQHLHPRMSAGGTWSTPIRLGDRAAYRVYADFKHEGSNVTLAHDLDAPGSARRAPWPAPATVDTTATGYDVRLTQHRGRLTFQAGKDGRPVEPEPYLGARGHLVALRDRDLAYLHVHPLEDELAFEVEATSTARYRLFVQFKHAGRVHTADFTQELSAAG